MSSELEVAGLTCTANHFMEKSLNRLGTEGKFYADVLAHGLPPIFFAYRVQRGMEKKTKEMKAKSLNKDEWFWDNGCVWLEMKCEVKSLVFLWRVLAHFIKKYV